MMAGEIIDALGGPGSIAGLLKLHPVSYDQNGLHRIRQWPRQGIPAKYWFPISQLPIAKRKRITMAVLQMHTATRHTNGDAP